MLGVVRLSKDTDDSTSVQRQRQTVTAWALANGHEVIGWAEDLDVSGSVSPWERPSLGPWLDRPDSFDVICAWRLDRLSRRVVHLAQLVEWTRERGIGLASASEGFDVTSAMGRVFVSILGALAEGELEAIRERAKASHTHLMKVGRFRGGPVPFGYRPVKADKGYRLEIDPETADVMREIVRRISADESTNSVCRWLNADRIPTPMDAQRLRLGKPTTGAEWRVGNLIKMLRSTTLLGLAEQSEMRKEADGRTRRINRPIRDEDGMPLQRAEPLITRAAWETLQRTLDRNGNKRAGNRHGGSMLLRVAYCECGEPMYRARSRDRWYYRCGLRSRSGRDCPAGTPSIGADTLEPATGDTFLKIAGMVEIVRRELILGSSHREELAAVERAMAELREDRVSGLYSGADGTADYRATYGRLEARRTALKALPDVPDTWAQVPTGETYADRFASLTEPDAWGRELRAAGLTVRVHARPQTQRDVTGDPDAPDDPDNASRMVIEIPADIRERIAQ